MKSPDYFRPWSLMTWVLLLLLTVNVVGIYVVGQRQSRLLRQQHALLLTIRGDLDEAADHLTGLTDDLEHCRGALRGRWPTSRDHHGLVVPVSLRESERP